MKIYRLLVARGIHYFVTRFGPRKLRSLAFDEKYRDGAWNFQGDGSGELSNVLQGHLRQGNLLIMGCGLASILTHSDEWEFNSALGVDISSEAIARAVTRFASDRVSFRVSDMESIQLLTKYNVILFSESLYYVSSSRQLPLLNRLGKALKPGGVFVVTFAQAQRYESILERIRGSFRVFEDRPFTGSSRHLIVFGLRDGTEAPTTLGPALGAV